MPSALSRFAGGGSWRRAAALSAPLLGAAVTALVLAGLAGWLRVGSIREPFVGWSEVTERARGYLAEVDPGTGGRRIVVADHYKLGANLELTLHQEADVYVLDHHKNHEHGRAPQLAAWGIDEEGLRGRDGDDALVVVEMTQTRTGEHAAWLAHAASFFDGFEPLGTLRVPSPGKRKKFKDFRFYRGRTVR